MIKLKIGNRAHCSQSSTNDKYELRNGAHCSKTVWNDQTWKQK